MIIRKVDLVIFPEVKDEFEKICATRNPALQKFKGCHRVELIKNPSIKNAYSTISLWDSEEDLNDYRFSEYFGETWKMFKPMFAKKAEAITYELIGQSSQDI